MNELRLAIPPGRSGFDVEQAGGNSDFHRLAYARLFVYPPTIDAETGALIGDVSRLEGQLAEGWEVSPDGRVYRVTLRRGILSPFGNELTAEDVRWGWERAFALRDVGKWVALVGSVPGPEAVVPVDRYTVEFRLRAANPTLLQQLTRSTPTIYDSTEARRHATAADPWAREWLAAHPAGYGPYALVSAEPWKETVFEASPAASIRPAFERVRFLIVPGRRRRLDLLREGAIDLLPDLTPAEAQALHASAGVRVYRSRSGSHVALMLNCQQPPFDNPLVRRAIAWAIPAQRILDEVYGGTAAPWRSPFPWPTPGMTEQFWEYDYDPARAAAALAEAGYGAGFASELFVDAANREHQACAEIVAQSLRTIGIDVAIERLDPATFWYGGRYLRAYPMLIWEDWHQVPDPYYALVHDYDPGRLGLINCGQYRNDRIAALIRLIENEPRWEARAALLREAQAIIAADAPNVPLAQPAVFLAARAEIKGLLFAPDRALRLDLLHRAETGT
ncbi:MAG: ABC transporter substrate-binding protein [Chloroflexota bacterium]|nr:ABC transporter substrate-binding protein [Dehalococcoidia bacterium]MDW8252746.1 ABC transporter substrate-binding protein [Chloroflexota bacterium]